MCNFQVLITCNYFVCSMSCLSTVVARDLDNGQNAEIIFEIDNPNEGDGSYFEIISQKIEENGGTFKYQGVIKIRE